MMWSKLHEIEERKVREELSKERAAWERRKPFVVEIPESDEPESFWAGLFWCCVVSLPIWGAIVAAAWWVSRRWF